MNHPTFSEVYAELARGPISPATVRAVFDAILAGAWTPVQVGSFATCLRIRGETSSIIAAAASALRAAMVVVEHRFDAVLDTCGTGGDGQGTLNLSTGAAIMAAATGLVVAKHGNRAISSKAGSADVLEALGIPVDLPAEAACSVLEEAGIAFMLAPTHHPAMRHAAQARKELGVRTLFNCLGPLANPARSTHQLIGASEDGLRRVLAEALGALGVRRAWVVWGEGGLDEVSPYGPTRVTQLSEGDLSEFVVSPADFGLAPCAPGAANGGDAAHNALAIEKILRNEVHEATNAFVINAAAALVVARGIDPRAAAEQARETLLSGAAHRVLETWRRAAQARRSPPS